MKGQRWIEYLDKKKIVWLTMPRKSMSTKRQTVYIVTVPIEWMRNFNEIPRVRVTIEVIE